MSILYCVSWTINSIWRPSTPPAALISFAASLAPLAAGRSSADSSPVSAKPPPTLIESPDPAGAAGPAVAAGAAAVGASAAGAAVEAGAVVVPPPHAARINATMNVSATSLSFIVSPFRHSVTLSPQGVRKGVWERCNLPHKLSFPPVVGGFATHYGRKRRLLEGLRPLQTSRMRTS